MPGKRPARAAVAVTAMALVFGSGFNAGCRRRQSPPVPSEESTLIPESCEGARRFPRGVLDDDVRFVDCDRPGQGTGTALSLGEPVYSPGHGPSAVEARIYAPGQCDHGGGSLTEHNIFFKPEHLDAAMECSRHRCDAGDRLGCRDLGALHWEQDILPAIRRDVDAALRAYRSGCDMGDGQSCATLAEIYDEKGEAASALAAHVAACRATPPEILACRTAADRLIRRGEATEAKALLVRGCRGVKRTSSDYTARRAGCAALADLAATSGDVVGEREYLRLECAYGIGERSACERLGLMILHDGDGARALPYLRKACGILPGRAAESPEACKAVALGSGGARPPEGSSGPVQLHLH
jgi:TPR repeat protein